jgi:hypothetical protein
VNLFFVKRSLNANEVHYDAVVDTENCRWKNPYVDSYWRDLAQGDDVYSKIRWWEQGAYGFVARLESDRVIEIRLEPLESAKIHRPVTARLEPTDAGCRVTTTIVIDGVETEFKSAYIKVSDSLLPSYQYFDILGYKKGKRDSGSESDRVFERFVKDRGMVFPEPPKWVYWRSGVVTRGLSMGRPD